MEAEAEAEAVEAVLKSTASTSLLVGVNFSPTWTVGKSDKVSVLVKVGRG